MDFDPIPSDILIVNIGGDGKAYPYQNGGMVNILRASSALAEEYKLKMYLVPFSYTNLRKTNIATKIARVHGTIIKPKVRFLVWNTLMRFSSCTLKPVWLLG